MISSEELTAETRQLSGLYLPLFRRYGFSNMRYIASLISGVGIFMMGAGLSWYHGIIGLLHPHPIESLLWVSGYRSVQLVEL